MNFCNIIYLQFIYYDFCRTIDIYNIYHIRRSNTLDRNLNKTDMYMKTGVTPMLKLDFSMERCKLAH